jgi:hypothetical protein
LALFNNADHDSLFANRVFEIFDKKKNNVIEFGEFVQALSVFHPKAPLAEKAECACGRVPVSLLMLWMCMHLTPVLLLLPPPRMRARGQSRSGSMIWGTLGRSIGRR